MMLSRIFLPLIKPPWFSGIILGKTFFESGGYNLGYNLVASVAQGDRPESIEGVGSFFLSDQRQKGGVGAASQLVGLL